MASLFKIPWFLTLALCLALSAGPVVNCVSTRSAQAEEISLETAEDETAQQLQQGRRPNESTLAGIRVPLSSFRRDTKNAVAAANNFSYPTERCRMNGFGGYLRN